MQETNFQMQWTDRQYKLEVNNSNLTGYSAKRLDIPSTSVEETSHTAQVHKKSPQRPNPLHTTWIRDELKLGFGCNVSTSLLKAQGYGHKWKDCWVPKSSYGQSSQMQPTLRQNRNPQPNLHNKRRMVYKWVPKPQSSSFDSSNKVTKPQGPSTLQGTSGAQASDMET